jgi:hypothetical protein
VIDHRCYLAQFFIIMNKTIFIACIGVTAVGSFALGYRYKGPHMHDRVVFVHDQPPLNKDLLPSAATGQTSAATKLATGTIADTPNPKASIAERVADLQDMLVRLSGQPIPEMRFLHEADWYAAADGTLETEDEIRLALSKLRETAQRRFAKDLLPAVMAYASLHPGKAPPGGIQDLQSYYKGTLDEALVKRYRVAKPEEFPNIGVGEDWVLTPVSLVDSKYDSRLVIGPHGFGASSPSR